MGEINGEYKGNLSFVFNKLSDLTPYIYFTNSYNYGNQWRRAEGYSGDGGASTGIYPGMLYIHNPHNDKAEINVAYTTFLNLCQESFLSANPDDYFSLTSGQLRIRHCYFNGLPGRQKNKIIQ